MGIGGISSPEFGVSSGIGGISNSEIGGFSSPALDCLHLKGLGLTIVAFSVLWVEPGFEVLREGARLLVCSEGGYGGGTGGVEAGEAAVRMYYIRE